MDPAIGAIPGAGRRRAPNIRHSPRKGAASSFGTLSYRPCSSGPSPMRKRYCVSVGRKVPNSRS